MPMIRYTCTLTALLLCLSLSAQRVFEFHRSTNKNYVCYDINLEDGQLCQKEPLKAYWQLHNRVEDLTFLDKMMAFGVKVLSAKADEAVIHLAPYKLITIRICQHKGKWVGIVKHEDHEMVLQKIFAQMNGSTSIRCSYIELIGTDIKTGEELCQRVTP